MKDINQFSITDAVKASFKGKDDARFTFLLEKLIDHLHDFTRETNLTHEEWMGVLMFLYDCGQISNPERHEFILLADVLGFSALVDMINSRGGATEGSNLGPFYLDNAPAKPLGADLADGRQGVTVLCTGYVRDTLGNPQAGAIIDTWQADGSGTYPIQEEGQDAYDLRGQFTCDAEGRYYYTTVLPKPYTVPYDGPVGKLLRAGERHAWRTAHLHYIIRATGMRAVTTEVFFAGTEYIDADAVFGVRSSLIATVEKFKPQDALGLSLSQQPDATIRFDFTVAPED